MMLAEMASPLTEVGAWHAGQNVCHMAYMAEVYVYYNIYIYDIHNIYIYT
jgi:hypothetical protein